LNNPLTLENGAWYAVKSYGNWFAGKYYSEYDEFYEESTGVPIAHRGECSKIVPLEG